ncbi:mtmr6 myotubularin related protein 6 [Protomyces lactucae-debilis]|uniref:Mtmr6 myotubularin related protein 6 n=1 Tax=Protomyces lactucae-debilis TaxID=2754530 RepID=A0A1Y2FF63_PROLT|nr:mtmr6 myotubularin related protein 6 [Protomyces lactucae-debilis]ORY82044.1 mtmr6 myotubularin related protein 6 [Protomyces lactucae-debilis]
MDAIKQARILNVELLRQGVSFRGTLFLTIHHLIFSSPQDKLELWICFPIIAHVERRPPSVGGFSALRIRCRDFTFLTLHFAEDAECARVFESVRSLTCVPTIDKLYAFSYKPGKAEQQLDSWRCYKPEREFARQGVGSTFPQWRLSQLNADYAFSPTYPAVLAIPDCISDNVLNYGGKYRSKQRVPVLTYIHALNGCTITRASQPMVGIKQNRSVQDEKLVQAIFNTTQQRSDVYGSSCSGHLIVDARPTANAMANVAMGAGSENMDHYPSAKKVYLGIENIHVMRDSLNKVVEAIKDSDLTPLPPSRDLLQKSNWLKHISNVLDGASIIARTVHLGNSHVLVHCSDGWDRTSQLCSLAEICLDPYYRTLEGFVVLVEKDWLSFGHRFGERCGHLSSEKSFVSGTQAAASSQIRDPTASPERDLFGAGGRDRAREAMTAITGMGKKLGEVGRSQQHLKYTSPIFHQFLDCVFQLLVQHPTRFEFNERFLRRLLYHTYSCQYGTFLFNTERERVEAKLDQRTRSVWDHFLAKRDAYLNQDYVAEAAADGESPRQDTWLECNVKLVKWWHTAFNREDAEMNTVEVRTAAGAGDEVDVVDTSVDTLSAGAEALTVS